MDIISMVAEAVAFITAFIIVITICKRDISYIGNKLFVISFLLYGIYALFLFIYEFPISILVNTILLQSSLSLIVLGTLIFVLSMQIFYAGRIYLKRNITKILIIISIIICILTFFFPYEVYQLVPSIEAYKNIVSLLATGIWAYILMIYNSISLFRILRNMDKSKKRLKRNITVLTSAQLIALLSPTMSVIGNIIENNLIHALMFVFLAIPLVLVGYTILRK
ncbi:MAG: hypothetical protein GF329_03730 [Candidatus Lokiarchaeota archaeon]|nr:hypothetical protein [Candidatus Lokiarchaeota archaeon]